MVTTRTKLPDLKDTIVALSSATGSAMRAIVRLSGRRAAEVVRAVCPEFARDRMAAGRFFSGQLQLTGMPATIAADVYFFPAPRTYTGDDVVEIHLISCGPIVEALLAACLNAGARAAEPGEFTLRAFLAGKLDLTRAEAVLGVIDAADRHQLQQALAQLAGGLAQPLRALREDLLNLLADIEAGLDFADEDIHFVNTDDMLRRLGHGLAHLTLLKKQLTQRALSQRPYRVVLAGKPNAGKSSLFNALVGADAALVNAVPGTTRDYLERTLDVAGARIELVDTAGLGAPGDAIEATSQDLGQQQTRNADLVLWCMACDDCAEASVPGGHFVRIATKADLVAPPAGVLATSVATGVGLEELRRRLAEEVRRAGHAPLAPSLSRCHHHVDACVQHLRNAHALVIDEGMPEILALEIRLTLEELGAMVGAVYTEDLLDRIFSRFCIGK